MPTTEELVQRVSHVILGTEYYRKMLKIECLYWRTLRVEIEDNLLHEPFLGEEKPSGFIGGTEKYPTYCSGIYWYPPSNTQLYRIYQDAVDTMAPLDRTEYFLLVKENSCHFVTRKTGKQNSLTLTEKSVLSRILESILSELEYKTDLK